MNPIALLCSALLSIYQLAQAGSRDIWKSIAFNECIEDVNERKKERVDTDTDTDTDNCDNSGHGFHGWMGWMGWMDGWDGWMDGWYLH